MDMLTEFYADRSLFSVEGRKPLLVAGWLVAAFLLWGSAAQAQHEVSGQVTDAEDGQALPGVNVVIKGTTTGASTGSNGDYSLTAPSENDTLVFSFVGYQGQEVPIQGRSEVNVALETEVTGLQEVVVNVGYGEQTVTTTTGSVSQVSGEDLEVKPVTNLSNTLAGSVPGIIGVNPSGEPGADGSDILIRGMATLNNNDPLVVIDGVPGRQGGLARLNASDIRSVTVLKDASAAIYGSRAANGVILVETKRGREGPPEVTVNVNQGYSQLTRTPEMVDAPTWMRMINEVEQYRGNQPRFTEEEIQKHAEAVEVPGPGDHTDEGETWMYHNTDWFAELIKPFSQQTKADVSVNGGGDNVRYFLSLSGLTEDGAYYNSATRYNQLGFRRNIDGDISENVRLQFNLHGRLEDRNYPTQSTFATFRMAQQSKPTMPAYWPNGKPGPDIEYGQNPVVISTEETGYDDEESYYFQSSLGVEAEIPAISGLTLNGDVAYDQTFRQQKLWQTPWELWYWDYQSRDEQGNPDLTSAFRGYPEPRLSQEHESTKDVMLRGTARYESGLGENHNYSVLLGSEYQWADNSWFSAFRRFYASDKIEELFAGGEAQRSNNGSGWHSSRLNYFTRVNYDYEQKYLFEFVGRYDGSYIFPEGNRFGFFPGFSVGWRLTQEDWFTNAVGFFDELKLRGSWGQTGNDQIEPYQYMRTYQFGSGYVLGGAVQNSITQARVPNTSITWEVANQLDVGVSGGVLDNRLTFEVAYFDYLREDILWWRGASIPESAGFSLPRENIGEVRSWGVDGTVGYGQDLTSNISFQANGNFSYATNEIQYWAESPGAPEYQKSTGAPMNTELYYRANGVFNDQAEIDNNPSWPGARPGDIRFEDVNGDGKINGLDRVRIDENSTPNIIYGLDLNASIHNFDARIQFQGAAQVRQYVQTAFAGEFGTYWEKFAERRWTPENPEREHPRAYNRQDPYWSGAQSTYFLRDASFIRLENIRLAYSLPSTFVSGYGFQNVQLYVSGNNLRAWSPMDIMDPESRDTDGTSYPPERVYNMGLQLSF